MKQKTLAIYLKWIVVGVGICGLLVYFLVFPVLGDGLRSEYPEFAPCFWPWLIFLWCTGIAPYAVLIYLWKIAGNIGRDRSFTMENAKFLKAVTAWTLGDCAFLFIGNLVFLLLDMSHPAVVLSSLVVVFGGVAVATASAVLARLVTKAARLQEENDLTI